MTLDIEALRELLAAATPGPWHINEDGEIYGPCPIVAACLVGIAPDEVAHLILQPEDAALICALRNQAGPLLDRLGAAELAPGKIMAETEAEHLALRARAEAAEAEVARLSGYLAVVNMSTHREVAEELVRLRELEAAVLARRVAEEAWGAAEDGESNVVAHGAWERAIRCEDAAIAACRAARAKSGGEA